MSSSHFQKENGGAGERKEPEYNNIIRGLCLIVPLCAISLKKGAYLKPLESLKQCIIPAEEAISYIKPDGIICFNKLRSDIGKEIIEHAKAGEHYMDYDSDMLRMAGHKELLDLCKELIQKKYKVSLYMNSSESEAVGLCVSWDLLHEYVKYEYT